MSTTTVKHEELMDNIYRYQRYFYDLTRKYYLFGRDTIIREMPIQKDNHVLELGCGTARNMILLANKHPNAYFYGIDASKEMLITARQNADRAKVGDKIFLQPALAEQVDYQNTFGLEEPFDIVFFSYALTMIPTWRESLQTAFYNLKPGGYLYIVDFWDQKDLPRWFQSLLTWWLSKFHVRYEPELLDYLQTLRPQCESDYIIHPIFKRYALWTCLQKARESN